MRNAKPLRAFPLIMVLSACTAGSGSFGLDGGSSDAGPSNDGGSSPPIDSSAPPDSATAASEGGSGDCNTLANGAPAITANDSTASLPTATGGTVQGGTYFLSDETDYARATNGSGGTNQETIMIAGSTLQIVKIGVTNPIDRTSWTFTTAGTTMNLTQTCPSAKTKEWGYSASGATLVTYDAVSNVGKTYTRQ
jgi:hypothetical protein